MLFAFGYFTAKFLVLAQQPLIFPVQLFMAGLVRVQMAIRRCPLSSCAVSRRRTHSAIASKREVKAPAEAQATVDIDQKKNGKLLAKTLPSSIETDEEFDWMAALLEEPTIPERALNGKRGIGKNQAKKLAEYFEVSVELFI